MNKLFDKVIVKPIPTAFVIINNKEYEIYKMLAAIDDMLDTSECDIGGDYSLEDDELHAPIDYYNCLIELGLVNNYSVKNYTGSRTINLFCMTEGASEVLAQMYNDLNDELNNINKEI